MNALKASEARIITNTQYEDSLLKIYEEITKTAKQGKSKMCIICTRGIQEKEYITNKLIELGYTVEDGVSHEAIWINW